MPTLRPYQSKAILDINLAWQGGANTVMLVMPTGAGKTVVFSEVIKNEVRPSCAIAHRGEIVAQISLALAKCGVRHRVIGQDKTRKKCERLQLKKLKRSYVDRNARCAVASVKTLLNLKDDGWFQTVGLWVGDEGHHFLRANEWGKAVARFPNARGLLVTATPCRADGHGLGRAADGLVDALVLGPTMRELINLGYLVGYRYAGPESDVNIANVELGADGDFKQNQLRAAFHASGKHCGHVVDAYKQYVMGKLTVVFSVDVEEARKTKAAFAAAGIPAAVVSAETDDGVREDTMRRFEAREILVLLNVDLFGEGYDLPNLEAVILDRHTESFSLYAQQWGRGTRLDVDDALMERWDSFTVAERLSHIAASRKPHMFLLDLVGNLIRHSGPPDKVRPVFLGRRDKRSNAPSDAIPYRSCANKDTKDDGSMIPCDQAYERYLLKCPYCEFKPEPPSRSAPEYVEGNIAELSEEALARMRQAVAAVAVVPSVPRGASYLVSQGIYNRHAALQQEHAALLNAMAWYGGYLHAIGATDLGEQRSRFYYAFGIDVGTAQALSRADAETLRARVIAYLAARGIDGAVTSGIN